ncbi:hypothetical protein RJ640_006154 [Escallonia rubra]|uniref:PIN domain-containing protein n=1 Tax=Escallonia rubra TaxID=112253 RepID=A0AA88SP64_9ASTE|nr:hypothetical protein RJ640_006154 [Escallonia rubra]
MKKIVTSKAIKQHKEEVLNPNKKDLEKDKLPRNVPNVSSALFFKHNNALGPPYRVLVDTNFINFSIKNKLDLEKGMMDCLYAKSVKVAMVAGSSQLMALLVLEVRYCEASFVLFLSMEQQLCGFSDAGGGGTSTVGFLGLQGLSSWVLELYVVRVRSTCMFKRVQVLGRGRIEISLCGLLGGSTGTPCITDCVMAELEKLGQKHRTALRIAKDPRFERLPCTHKGTYADDCIVERVTQHKCYMVATCDRDLKRRIRKLQDFDEPLVSKQLVIKFSTRSVCFPRLYLTRSTSQAGLGGFFSVLLSLKFEDNAF